MEMEMGGESTLVDKKEGCRHDTGPPCATVGLIRYE